MDIFKDRPFAKIYEQFKEQPRIKKIQTLESLDQQTFFEEVFPAHYPVVFNLQTELKSKETIVTILKSLDLEIDVRVGEYANPDKYIKERKLVKKSISSYIDDNLYSKEPVSNYAGNFQLPCHLLETVGCVPPEFFNVEEYEPPTCWLGGTGCITPLHKDGSKNFAVHLFGKKKWTLIPPRDASFLYMNRVLEHSDFAPSGVDLANPDLKRFPEYKHAISLTTLISGGQILFLPEGWGHYVENLEPTLMVNYWHKNRELL